MLRPIASQFEPAGAAFNQAVALGRGTLTNVVGSTVSHERAQSIMLDFPKHSSRHARCVGVKLL
jgi:hypothetical protein